mmetsp:Transcript_117969/g.229361  ORF Transcript_117969/g.229361 Transcript_117969/m.229361 type:complete len:81 (+) Transcript_117969:24-266(+)
MGTASNNCPNGKGYLHETIGKAYGKLEQAVKKANEAYAKELQNKVMQWPEKKAKFKTELKFAEGLFIILLKELAKQSNQK